MDAAKLSSSRTALLFSLALLVPAGAFAQAPAFQLAGGSSSTASVTLVGNNPSPVSIASSGNPIGFAAQTVYDSSSAGVKWLCLNPSPAGLAGASGTCDSASGLMTPDTFDIQIGQNANSSQLTQTQHTAIITLTATDGSGAAAGTITVYYTPGSNGGNTTGAVTASPSSINQTVAYGSQITIPITLISTSPTPVTFTLSAPSVNWATNFTTTGGLSQGTVSSGSPVSLEVTLNGAGQFEQVLNTSLFVTYNGNTLTIPVTFGNGVNAGGGSSGSLSVSQTSVQWSYSTGGSFPSAAQVTVSSSAGAIGFGDTVSSSNSWLFVSPQSGTLPATLTINPTSNIAALATGSYTGTINITGTDGSTATITVTLTINGGSASGLTVLPNPINLQTPVGGSTVQQTVTVTSITGGTITASVNGTGLSEQLLTNFLTANVSSNAVTVFANPSGLSNATYTGSLLVTVGNVSQSVPVNFTVGTGSTGGGTTSFAAAPSSLNFVYETGSGMPINQQQQVYLAGSGSYTATATNNTGGSWLSVPATSGTLPNQFAQIVTNASGLAAGTYTGAVTFTNSSTGQTSVVSVTLLVTGTSAAYPSPGDVIFNYIGGTSSSSQFQNLFIYASDNSTIQTSAAVSNTTSAPWLSVTSNGGNSYSVTANAANQANGLYTGYITVTSSTANSPITVPVVLNVTGSSVGSGGSGSLTLGTSAITLQPASGASATAQLSVSANTATNFTASVSTSNCGNAWLSISPFGSSVTNTTITVTGNAAGISSGQTCNGTITLTSGTGSQTVPVAMIVGGTGGAGGNITVTANGAAGTPSLTFSAPSVGAAVTAQYLTVTSASGSSAVSFTAALSGANCTWVNLGITAGQSYQTPLNNLNVGATTTGLAAGTYNCTLTLSPNGGTAVMVPLTLTVVGMPTISVATTTLSFSYAAGSAAPASQTLQVTGSGSAAATFTAAAASTPSGWLSVTPTSGTASAGSPASLTVSVNPANLTAGSYTGTITLAPGTGSTGSGTVTVTLTVTAPTPSIVTVVNAASFLGGAVSPGEVVTLMGTMLGPLTPLGPSIGSNGNITTTQGNVQVFFGGTPAPLTYVSSIQINCVVPYEVAGLTSVPVQVKYLSQPSNSVTLSVANSAPGIFSATGSGTGQGAILNQNSTLNTAGNPATKGSIIQIFMTGEGVTSPAGTDGAVTANATTVPVLPIAVMIGGQPATVVFKGEAPGIVAGVLQLNVTIPPTVSSGANQVSVTIGSNTSQANLTVAVM